MLEARLKGPEETPTVSGVVPYADNALALSGELFATDPAADATYPRLRFFIGGAWPDPGSDPHLSPACKSPKIRANQPWGRESGLVFLPELGGVRCTDL